MAEAFAYSARSGVSGLFVIPEVCEHQNARRLEQAARDVVATLPRTEAEDGFDWP